MIGCTIIERCQTGYALFSRYVVKDIEHLGITKEQAITMIEEAKQ